MADEELKYSELFMKLKLAGKNNKFISEFTTYRADFIIKVVKAISIFFPVTVKELKNGCTISISIEKYTEKE